MIVEGSSQAALAGAIEQISLEPSCYSVSIFTQKWAQLRDFYSNILKARVVSERAAHSCEMILGGLPICLRQCEFGEAVSYVHLYLSVPNPEPVLRELRRRGIIVTTVGPYTNFRDPEGRVIKMSRTNTAVT